VGIKDESGLIKARKERNRRLQQVMVRY
jgi:hypothetical protein